MFKQMVHTVNVPYPFQALLLLAPPTVTLISSVRFMCFCVYVYIYIYIQGVTGGKDQTSGGCSLC